MRVEDLHGVVQVRHLVTAAQVETVVAAALLEAELRHRAVRLTRTYVDSVTRDALTMYGTSGIKDLEWSWPDHDWASAKAAASVRLQQLYPELYRTTTKTHTEDE